MLFTELALALKLASLRALKRGEPCRLPVSGAMSGLVERRKLLRLSGKQSDLLGSEGRGCFLTITVDIFFKI